MTKTNSIPDFLHTPFYDRHLSIIVTSFFHCLQKKLIDSQDDMHLITKLWDAPFALVSHGVEDDPVFNFANRQALDIFEMDFTTFTKLPSRLSAEPVERKERERLLAEVTKKGYIANYQGIRISSTGKRFEIREATVWNLYDEKGEAYGQAAMFDQWTVIE